MNTVYIIFSPTLKKFYTGFTQDDVQNRLNKHNSNYYGINSFTSTVKDWKIFLTISCHCQNQAINIERHIKKMKSAIYINNLKKYPEIINKLLKKYTCT